MAALHSSRTGIRNVSGGAALIAMTCRYDRIHGARRPASTTAPPVLPLLPEGRRIVTGSLGEEQARGKRETKKKKSPKTWIVVGRRGRRGRRHRRHNGQRGASRPARRTVIAALRVNQAHLPIHQPGRRARCKHLARRLAPAQDCLQLSLRRRSAPLDAEDSDICHAMCNAGRRPAPHHCSAGPRAPMSMGRLSERFWHITSDGSHRWAVTVYSGTRRCGRGREQMGSRVASQVVGWRGLPRLKRAAAAFAFAIASSRRSA